MSEPESMTAQPSAGAQGEAVAWLTPGGDVTRSHAYAVEQSANDPTHYPKPLGLIGAPDIDCISLLADLDAGKPVGREAAATIRSLISERATPAQPDTSMQSKMVARLEAVANLIQRPPLDDVLIDQSTALTLAADIRAIIANQPDTGVALSASDRACYDYPGVDQGPLRDAFVAGAEAYAQPDTGDVAALREAKNIIDSYFMDDDYDANGALRKVSAVLDAALSKPNAQGREG